MEPTTQLDQALQTLNDNDLVSLRQQSTLTLGRLTGPAYPSLSRWNDAVSEVLDHEEQRRHGTSGSVQDRQQHLRIAAAALTERELFLLTMEYEVTIGDVETHWGRSYLPFLTTLRNTLRHHLARRHDPRR